MQYPIPHSDSTQTIESLEQPSWKTLQEAKYPATSPAKFQLKCGQESSHFSQERNGHIGSYLEYWF